MSDPYDARLSEQDAVVVAVVDDVRGWPSIYVARDGPHRITGVKRTQTCVSSRYGSTMLSPMTPTPVPESAAVAAVGHDFEVHTNWKQPGTPGKVITHSDFDLR